LIELKKLIFDKNIEKNAILALIDYLKLKKEKRIKTVLE